MKRDLPDVHFGSPENKPLDWRKMPDTEGPDDDELRPPAKSVVKLLKLNPLKLFMPPKNKDHFHEESAIIPDWWNKLNRQEQQFYVDYHPGTHLTVTAPIKNLKPIKVPNKISTKLPISNLVSKFKKTKNLDEFASILQSIKNISENDALGILKISIDRNFNMGAHYTGKLIAHIKTKDGQLLALKMFGSERLEDEQVWITPYFRGDTLDEASKHVSNYYFDLFSSRYSKFIESFDDIWLGEGSSEAHRRVWAIYKNYGNKKLYIPVPLTEGEEVISQNIKANVERLHNKTKLYLMKKYKINDMAKLDTTYITLYRGLGHIHKKYTPSPTESWADDFESAKSYANLLGNKGSVIETKVPLSSILFTEKSMEKDVKEGHGGQMRAKEEFVVLGGAIDKIKTIY